MQDIYKDIFKLVNNKKIDKQKITENRYFSLFKVALKNPINNYEYFVIRIWKNNLAEVVEYKLIDNDNQKIYSFSDGYEICDQKVKRKINFDFIKLNY